MGRRKEVIKLGIMSISAMGRTLDKIGSCIILDVDTVVFELINSKKRAKVIPRVYGVEGDVCLSMIVRIVYPGLNSH